jgi:hypothetical protein
VDPGELEIRGEIKAQLRKRQPQSTRELHKRLGKSGCRLRMGELGGILERWRSVEDFSDDPGRHEWQIVLRIEPEDLSDGPILF